MNFFYASITSLNRFQKSRKYFGWLIRTLVFFQSLHMWLSKKEYQTFANCLFHNKKQARSPWIHERSIEYSWIYSNIKDIKNCRVLDVGAMEGLPSTDMLLENNNIVYTIDINASPTNQSKSNLIVVKGDIQTTNFSDDFFDIVIAISTLEHIGISGRYGIIDEDKNGDFKAMQEISRILKSGGSVYITVPYGTGNSLPLNRLYDADRINHLFASFTNRRDQYYQFMTSYNIWLEVTESVAAANNWDREPWYSLGCFYAKKPIHSKKINS